MDRRQLCSPHRCHCTGHCIGTSGDPLTASSHRFKEANLASDRFCGDSSDHASAHSQIGYRAQAPDQAIPRYQ